MSTATLATGSSAAGIVCPARRGARILTVFAVGWPGRVCGTVLVYQTPRTRQSLDHMALSGRRQIRAAARSASIRSVRSQEKSGSSRPK
jgi:hypothetical protein